jgi:hypothetical protein
MDPFSITGIALGAYPVLAHAFTQYREGIENFQNWKRFRRQFEEFGILVEGQRYLFESVIQDLLFGGLNPLPLGGIFRDQDEVLSRMRDKTDSIWENDLLEKTVRSRLNTRYEWFMRAIRHINEILEGFYVRLKIPEVS